MERCRCNFRPWCETFSGPPRHGYGDSGGLAGLRRRAPPNKHAVFGSSSLFAWPDYWRVGQGDGTREFNRRGHNICCSATPLGPLRTVPTTHHPRFRRQVRGVWDKFCWQVLTKKVIFGQAHQIVSVRQGVFYCRTARSIRI